MRPIPRSVSRSIGQNDVTIFQSIYVMQITGVNKRSDRVSIVSLALYVVGVYTKSDNIRPVVYTNSVHPWGYSPMIFTRDYIIHENHSGISLFVTKLLFTVSNISFFVSYDEVRKDYHLNARCMMSYAKSWHVLYSCYDIWSNGLVFLRTARRG